MEPGAPGRAGPERAPEAVWADLASAVATPAARAVATPEGGRHRDAGRPSSLDPC